MLVSSNSSRFVGLAMFAEVVGIVFHEIYTGAAVGGLGAGL